MTLKELRKKYVGVLIPEDKLKDDSCELRTDDKGKRLRISFGDIYVYYATLRLDENNRILEISRMTCEELVSDEATHVNYKPRKVYADDYDILDTHLRGLI